LRAAQGCIGPSSSAAVVGGGADVVSGAFEHTVNMQHKGQRMRAFALLLDALVGCIERRLMRWQPRAGETEKL
jgi:hypothetical protein